MVKVVAEHKVNKWEEVTLQEVSDINQKVTRVSAIFGFSGDMIGEATVEYTMYYLMTDPTNPHLSNAVYNGFIRFTGTLAGKEGAFVMEDRGSFKEGVASSTLSVVPGSGLGDIGALLQGVGLYKASADGFRFELDVDFGSA